MKRLIFLVFSILFLSFAQPGLTQEPVPDVPLQNVTVPFSGQWLPDNDPAEIGQENFKTLENMRYRTGGIEGVQGYTKINTTAINEAQDYTDYTEEDAPARVAVAASQLTITDLDQDEEVYVYYDFGADYFDGNFEVQFDVNVNVASNEYCYVLGLANDIDDLYATVETNNKDGLVSFIKGDGGTFRICIKPYNSGTSPGLAAQLNLSLSTDYYITIKRDESIGSYGQFQLWVYSDPGRTVSMDGGAGVDLTEKADFRYLYAMSAYKNGDTGKTFNGTISNLKVVYDPQNGFHFKKDQPAETHVLIQGIDAEGRTKVFQNTTAIPDQGNFSTTALHNDASGAGLGRFSNAPGGMAYCNQKENMIWSGDEMPISGFIALTQIENTYTLSFNTTADTIIDDGGANFVTDGYKPGQTIDVTGSVDNNRSLTIKTISDSAATNDMLTVVENLNTQANDAGCTLTSRIETKGYKDPIDYIEAVNNKLTTPGNLALVGGGGIDSYTELMIHANEADGTAGTGIIDFSLTPKTITANGNAQVDTSQAKFGSGSVLFDGTGDYLSVSDDHGVSDYWHMDAGKFTLDCRVQFKTVAAGGICQQRVDDDNRVYFYYDSNHFVYFVIRSGGINRVRVFTSFHPVAGVWYHLAAIRGWENDADKFVVTIDGVAENVVTDVDVWPDLNADLEIGKQGSFELDGHIDEFRVSKGIARWTANFTPPAKAYKTSQLQWLVLSPRPLQGLKYYVNSVNTVVSTTTGKVWNGHSFSDLTITDGTKPASISLAQDGSMTFDSTVGTAKQFHFGDSYLYAYLFELSAGDADIYHVTADAPFQAVPNVWDEVYRQAIAFQAYLNGFYEDYAAAVFTPSGVSGSFGAEIKDMTATEHFIVMFEEQISALFIGMASGTKVNVIPSIPTVEYYNGSEWTEVSGLVDSSSGDDNDWETLGQTGLISWSPPNEYEEVQQTLFGITGYAYRFKVSATLTDTTVIDTVYGIPAQTSIPTFKFPAQFKNRLLLCGNIEGKQGNRIDYSMPNASDVWNGELSSMNGIQSIYVAGEADLTCGTQIYNRYGSNVFAFFLAFKNNELYVIAGDNPEDFKWFPVSTTIGCPAPLTLDKAEVGYKMTTDASRQIALWVDTTGPMMFDGGIIVPIKGVKTFFDPASDNCITLASIEDAIGWYDSTYGEYNIVFPVDSLWLVYDLLKQRWYTKVPATYPTCAFPVRDVHGVQYIYAGLDTGYMLRLENGTTWDGTGIAQTVETGDFFPSKDMWHKTRLRRFKIAAKDVTEALNLAMTHYVDTATSGTSLTALDLSSGANRIVRDTQSMNLLGWSHRMKFTTTSSSTKKGFQPLVWGYQYRIERIDQ